MGMKFHGLKMDICGYLILWIFHFRKKNVTFKYFVGILNAMMRTTKT